MVAQYYTSTQVLKDSDKTPKKQLQISYKWDISKSVPKKPSKLDSDENVGKKHGYSSTVPECKWEGKTRAKPDALSVKCYNQNDELVSKFVDSIKPSDNTGVSMIAYPHQKTVGGSDEYFFDWFGFVGIGLTNVRQRHVEFLREQLIEGRFFSPLGYSESELLPYEWLPSFVEVQPNTGKRYDYAYKNALGVWLFVREEPDNPEKIESLSVRFSGDPLKALIPRNNQLKLAQLTDMMVQLDPKMHLSRADITHSFPRSRLSADDLMDAMRNRDYCGFKRRYWIADFLADDSSEQTYSFKLGHTGQGKDGKSGRRSDKLIGIYDERPVHGRDNWRVEGRFLSKYARLIQDKLIEIYNDKSLTSEQKNVRIVEWMRDFLYSRRTFDFVERQSIEGGKYRKDYKRKQFWQKHLDDSAVNALTYRFAATEGTVQSSFDHLFSRGLGTLVSVDIAQGREEVHILVDALLDAYHSKRKGMTTETVNKIINEMNLHGFRWNLHLFSPDLRQRLARASYYRQSEVRGNFTEPNVLYRRDLRTYPDGEQLEIAF